LAGIRQVGLPAVWGKLGKARGGQGEPVEGFGRGWGGSWWRLQAEQGAAVALLAAAGVPAGLGRGAWVWELH